jgi:hypothetical protein
MARLALIALAVSLAITYGAVIPREDDFLFDTIQSFLAAPDAYASALGFSRVKRSSGDWDKEFNLDSVGVSVKIKYDDPNNQLKGGRAHLSVDNLKKYIKRAKSSKVELDIKFDGGDSPRDGLFSMEVNYELTHDGVEKGVFTASRSMSGGLWQTHLENKNLQKPNGTPIFQAFDIKAKSDRKTMATGTYNSARFGSDYTFNVDRVPGEKLDAVLEGNGKKYVLNAVMDKEDHKVTVNLDANGFDYKLEVDADYEDDEVELDITVNLGSSGSYSVVFSGKKDMTDAKLAVIFNNNPFFKVSVKGKQDLANMNFKYQANYNGVLGNGKVRFARTHTKDGGLVKLQYLPDGGLDLKLEGKRVLKANNGLELEVEATRGGEDFWKYHINFDPVAESDGYEMNVNSQFDIFNEDSIVYTMFCNQGFGCFKQRSLKAKMYVNKDKPYKVDFDLTLFKDDEEVLMADINTKASPYMFVIKAPRILPNILPTGRESIEFKADHNPGQYLHVKSNTNMLSSFNVDKLDNGMRRIELNGKELLQADFSKGDNMVSQTTTLPNGKSLTTTIKWDSDNMRQNKVNLKLDGTERQLDAEFEWDTTNTADMTFKAHGKGQNERWGNYEISRDMHMSSQNGVLKIDATGNANMEKFWMPSPIETVMKVMLDVNTKDYMFDLSKTFDGKKMGVVLNNGRISLTL